jgi:tetratricopeptide (TPR) repeat protein
MKKFLAASITLFLFYNVNCQKDKNESLKVDLLKEFSEKACECVDSIYTYDKSKDEISAEISRCINNQTGAYQLGVKMMDIVNLADNAEEKDGKKQINININMNVESDEYKEYYFELERYMMDNCKPLRSKISASDKESEKSVSQNPEALKWYSKGIEASNKENYKKALGYYAKAVELDSNFAFAWDNIGICNRKLGNYDEALYAYKRSLEIDSMGVMPLQNIAVVYTYKKQYDNAIKSYERLMLVDKNNPEIYYGIGQVYFQHLNEYEKSLDYMCKAYNLYVEQKSPYRTDAEQIIRYIYVEMKKAGKEDRFNEILKENNITSE